MKAQQVMAGILITAVIALWAGNSTAASARCVVVEKKGNILVMDCGDRAKGFTKKGRVKIKTDRDKQ